MISTILSLLILMTETRICYYDKSVKSEVCFKINVPVCSPCLFGCDANNVCNHPPPEVCREHPQICELGL